MWVLKKSESCNNAPHKSLSTFISGDSRKLSPHFSQLFTEETHDSEDDSLAAAGFEKLPSASSGKKTHLMSLEYLLRCKIKADAR